MRRLIIFLSVLCFMVAIPAFAAAENGIVQAKDYFDIDEPTGMAYLYPDGGYYDLFPMDNDLGTHDKGTEVYWTIWKVLGSAPLYAAQLPDTEEVFSTIGRTTIPARDESAGAFKVEYGEDSLTAEMFDGWNLMYITVRRGDETTDAGWHIVLNDGDMDVLNAARAAYED